MYTKEDIFCQLKAMDAPRDKIVLVHTSLRLIGDVEGGAKGLLDILIEYFTGMGGLLCIPAHTWDLFGKNAPVLDMTKSHTCLGAFPKTALDDPRAIRSQNPTHSMAVFGDKQRADDFLRGEEQITNPVSPDSCYGKLAYMDGYVLLAGVNHSRNTFLHSAEEIAGIPGRMTDINTPVTIRHKSGRLQEREWYMFSGEPVEDVSLRFPKYEIPFRYHRCIKDGFLGDAPSQMCNAKKMCDVIEMIYKSYGEPLADEELIPPKAYVSKTV